jgi:hypothetical protein
MKSFIFHTIANIWVGEQANLRILGFNVFDDSWRCLRCPNPRLQISVGDMLSGITVFWTYNTTQNRAFRKLCSKRVFVAHPILDEHDGGCIIDHRSQRLSNGILIDCFVNADNIVIVSCGIYRLIDNYGQNQQLHSLKRRRLKYL